MLQYFVPVDSLLRRCVCLRQDDFVKCVTDEEGNASGEPNAGYRVASTYNILRKTEGLQKINLADFCLFYILMARPDPEVDIAFLLMDQNRSGTIHLDDFKVRNSVEARCCGIYSSRAHNCFAL